MAVKDKNSVYLDHARGDKASSKSSVRKTLFSYREHNAARVIIINERGEVVYYDPT